MNWWYLIGSIVALCLTVAFLVSYYKKRKTVDVLYQDGGVVYVPPEAILQVSMRDFDMTKIRDEVIDRVMRIQIKSVILALLDPATIVLEERERNNLKRLATVHSAMSGETIPDECMLVDRETKGIYLLVKNRMALINVSRVPVGYYTGSYTDPADRLNTIKHTEELDQERKEFIKLYSSLDSTVQQEFIQMLGQNKYEYFHVFATRCRRRFTAAQRKLFKDETIQSIITAYAARTGLKIPKSYGRFDSTAILLMNWDELPRPRANVLQFKIPEAIPSCECGKAFGSLCIGKICTSCGGAVKEHPFNLGRNLSLTKTKQ